MPSPHPRGELLLHGDLFFSRRSHVTFLPLFACLCRKRHRGCVSACSVELVSCYFHQFVSLPPAACLCKGVPFFSFLIFFSMFIPRCRSCNVAERLFIVWRPVFCSCSGAAFLVYWNTVVAQRKASVKRRPVFMKGPNFDGACQLGSIRTLSLIWFGITRCAAARV